MKSPLLNFDQFCHKIVHFWLEGFDRMFGTNKNWGKWSDMVAVMLADIISYVIKLEKIFSVVPEWLVILLDWKIHGEKKNSRQWNPKGH